MTLLDLRHISPARGSMIRRLHTLGNSSSVIAQRYNVQSSTILQYVDRHGLDTDYERLSDLSRELGLDSETLPQYARAGQIPQAVKRAAQYNVSRHQYPRRRPCSV